jgi:hypothetical protein
MSSSSVVNTATTAFNVGIIIAIVVGSLIGLCFLISVIVILYCICCRKPKTYPGAVVQVPPYPGPFNQPSPYPGPFNQPSPYPGPYNQPSPYSGNIYNNQPINTF